MAEPIQPLVNALSVRDDLTADEVRALHELPIHLRSFPRGSEIVGDHTRPGRSSLVIEGMCGRVVQAREGRQITAVHVPGDFVDLHSLLLKVMDHSVIALSDCQVGTVSHGHLVALGERHPHLGRLLWLCTVIDGAIQRSTIANIGRRSAMQRLAHLVCELHTRLSIVGLAAPNGFTCTFTQNELGDILGLSAVHVNRTIRDLRNRKLLSWSGNQVLFASFESLAAFADFDPTYLNLRKEPR
jgi:CRP-like cAMP-binding protein